MILITADEIEKWADTHEAEGIFPLLIRNILLNKLSFNEFDMPTQSSIWKGGFDGRILVNKDIEFFEKDTIYIFEFGKNKDYKNKFKEDILKVPKHINTDFNKYTFIFVSPRKIELTERNKLIENVKQNTAELNKLKDIKIIDVDDIERWLNNDLATSIWFAQQIDKPIILETAELFFDKWLKSTERIRLDEDIILARNKDYKENIVSFLNNKTPNIIIKSNSKQESILYFISTIKKLSFEEREKYLSKIIICDDEKTWKEITCYTNIHEDFILIPNFDNIPNGLALSAEKFKIMIPLGKNENLQNKHNILQLADINKTQVLELLSKQIDMEDAYKLLKESNYNLFFLQRLDEKKNSPLPIPKKKNETNAPYLIATAFLREFNENNEFDKEIILKLLNEDWNSVRKQLYYLNNLNNSPISKIGEFWKNDYPEIVVNYYLDSIDKKMLDVLFKVASEKLSKIDDKYNKTPEDRFFYFSKSVNEDISENLKKSLPKTLALIASLNEKNLINPQYNVQNEIDYVVRKVFANSQDWKLWATLGDSISLLAEASPKEFLEIVSNIIDNKNTIKEIFEQSSGNSIFTQCIQAPILFALESLAWNKIYLPTVCKILLNMHLQDEGKSKYENRPLNSLTDILTPWNLQTTASIDDIEEILSSILERFKVNDVKFDFLVRLVDKHVGSITSKPKYRRWNVHNRAKISNTDFNKFISFLFDNIFKMLGNKGEYWARTLKIALNSNIEIINKFILKIDKKDFSEFDDLSLLNIKNCIANIFHYITIKKDLDNEEVYDKNVIKVLKDVFYNKIKFNDYIYNYLHLYSKENGYNHNLENKNRLEEQLALQDIIKKEKIDGLIRFICLTELKHLVAFDLSNIDLSKEEINEIIIKILKDKKNIDFSKNIGFLSDFISSLYYFKGFSCLDVIDIKNLEKEEIVLLVQNIRIDKNILEWTKSNNIDAEYLQKANSYIIVEKKDNFDFILKELLNKNLYFKAFNLIALNLNKFLVPIDIILQVLKMLDLNKESLKKENLSLFSYHLKQIFEILYKNIEVQKGYLFSIKIKYFYHLQPEFKFPKFIKHEFFNNAQFFVDIIKIFLSHQEKQHIEVIYNILRTFIEYDLNTDNIEDMKFLSNIYVWVKNVINLSKNEHVNIFSMVKQTIGERLARTPIDQEDKIFPHKEVRKVLEDFDCKELRDGFLIELFNKRGVVVRELHSGGKLEKELAQQYNEYADRLQNQYPTTAKILREMASRYEFDSNELDKREELDDY